MKSQYFRFSFLVNVSKIPYYSPKAMLRFGRIMEILYRAKTSVNVFGYNSTESKPIFWMKSGAL